MTEEQMYSMSDEDLERLYLEAKADGASPNLDVEEDEIDMEQPVEDSDDNGTEIVELDEGEEEPTEVDGSDEIAEVEEELTEEPKDDEIEEVQEVQKFKFKVNGKEYEFIEDEMKN